jgi:hypothetical protein
LVGPDFVRWTEVHDCDCAALVVEDFRGTRTLTRVNDGPDGVSELAEFKLVLTPAGRVLDVARANENESVVFFSAPWPHADSPGERRDPGINPDLVSLGEQRTRPVKVNSVREALGERELLGEPAVDGLLYVGRLH